MSIQLAEKAKNAWDKMITRLEGWLDALIVNLPNLIIAIVVFSLSLILSKYISRLVLKVLKKSKLQPSMRNLISKIVSIMIVLLGLFLILGILNLSKTLNTVLAGAGVAGLAVGLALQGALANTYSGIVLSYIKNIKFGDWVTTNGYEGEVVDIDLRAVTLKEVDNNLVYIPNKLVVEKPIKNHSITDQSRVIVNCGVGYGSDLRKVRDIVVQVIVDNFDYVNKAEDVIFLYREFGDSSINFETRFWINSKSGLEVAKAKTEAIILIKDAFDENGINIPFPIRTMNFPEVLKIEQK
ncbi:mechanosensitive ion channel family protein [Sungkyunkwania multivorans]|uniref:Mechanosensitive ion channel family protein n=1 Tax=Sungkyunkwania multivorans TaxID=1173618 RepID=A0ABW3CSI9_9FLAO